MSNVVALPGKAGRVLYTGENWLEGLQHELKLYAARGGSFKKLSKSLGGHPVVNTISRIAYGETTQPRASTVILLFYALGFQVTVSK